MRLSPSRAKLSRKELRRVESYLGIFLDVPRLPLKTNCQQFAVYDEDEVYVGDICSKEQFFTEEELGVAIQKAFHCAISRLAPDQ